LFDTAVALKGAAKASIPSTQQTLGDAAARFLARAGTLPGTVVHSDGTVISDVLGASQLTPLAQGRGVRIATDHQRKALAIRDKGCVIPGCDIEATRTQVHHVHNWAHGGRTDLNNMALLCWHHHRELDLHRVELTRNQHTNESPTTNSKNQPNQPFWNVTNTPRNSWRSRR